MSTTVGDLYLTTLPTQLKGARPPSDSMLFVANEIDRFSIGSTTDDQRSVKQLATCAGRDVVHRDAPHARDRRRTDRSPGGVGQER
jgi:hypothetical protein